jgi:hypothetical protein
MTEPRRPDPTRPGLTAAAEALLPEALEAAIEPDPEQLGLLPLAPARTESGQAVNRHGRPLGSRSKRTEAWVDFLLSRYRSPLVGMAELYSRPVGELARELQCTPHEAMQIQLNAMRDLAPYLHQKLPQALQVQVERAIPLVLAVMPAGTGPMGENEEDQGLIPLLPAEIARRDLHASSMGEPDQSVKPNGQFLQQEPPEPESPAAAPPAREPEP